MPEPEQEAGMAIDPITIAVGNELAKAGGGVLTRLFGPTAGVMGQQLLHWYEKRFVKAVIDRADQMPGEGTIPLRVAAEVFEKAQWAENEFVAEYLSGVLASSRTPDGKDDRGVSWTALVGRMSSDQLRLHYILCRALRDHLVEEHTADTSERTLSDALEDKLVLHQGELHTALLGPAPEPESETERLVDALFGLDAEGLIKVGSIGMGDWLNESNHAYRIYPDWPIAEARVTTRGARLIMQAAGLGDTWPLALENATDNPLDRILFDEIPHVRSLRYKSLPDKIPRTPTNP